MLSVTAQHHRNVPVIVVRRSWRRCNIKGLATNRLRCCLLRLCLLLLQVGTCYGCCSTAHHWSSSTRTRARNLTTHVRLIVTASLPNLLLRLLTCGYRGWTPQHPAVTVNVRGWLERPSGVWLYRIQDRKVLCPLVRSTQLGDELSR